MNNILTIDVEDWFHFINSKYVPAVSVWNSLDSHVERMTYNLLQEIRPCKATFFCLGWVVQKFPALIQSIAAEGHELASHGYDHKPIGKLSPKEFFEQITFTKKMLEDISGQEIKSYRAPGYSIGSKELWAFEYIAKAGYSVDSSVFPTKRSIGLGGISSALPYPHILQLENASLIEIPVSTIQLLGQRYAFCGGGFFRLFPYLLIKKLIQHLNKNNQPTITYLHPRDIDTIQPHMKLEPFNSFMHHCNLSKGLPKLKKLLKDFKWCSIQEYLNNNNTKALSVISY